MPDLDTGWPYDADQHDPLTKLRIAVVGHAWPRWNYIVAFDTGRLDEELTRPTDQEAAMIVSFLEEYIGHWYNETWKDKLRQRPFDIDGGANGVTFRKWGDNDWGYRRRTWTMGPTYVPTHPRTRSIEKSPGPLTLLQVMDRIHTMVDEVSPHWLEWKATHPEIFGEAPDDHT
ncbi:hypothetical protein [Nonomuraea typhae]|uniref:hypothetical protein n=1 Tax=Nonomuraea typhae TaxID=2603600 RepID=UPI0012FB261C|nr:hypothetical protein [Nonomuraea typhae]